MEKIIVKAMPASTPMTRARFDVSSARLPSAGPRLDWGAGSLDADVADGEFFVGLLDRVGAPTAEGADADDAASWFMQDQTTTSIDVDPATESAPDQRLESSVDALSGVQVSSVMPGTAPTMKSSASFGERSDRWNEDPTSTDQFTIDHPRWGLIEVDSRRSVASWELTVRCADAETRQRLRSQEREFHDLLRRDYGAALVLDVQSVSAR